jgi:hypothetical protein
MMGRREDNQVHFCMRLISTGSFQPTTWSASSHDIYNLRYRGKIIAGNKNPLSPR